MGNHGKAVNRGVSDQLVLKGPFSCESPLRKGVWAETWKPVMML